MPSSSGVQPLLHQSSYFSLLHHFSSVACADSLGDIWAFAQMLVGKIQGQEFLNDNRKL